MSDTEKHINHLKWDSDFLGFKVGEIHNAINAGFLDEILIYCKKKEYRLIYFRTDDLDYGLYDTAIKNKGFIADRRVTYRILLKEQCYQECPNIIKAYSTKVTPDLLKIVLETGAFSRFNTDPNIGRSKYEELYSIWIEKSLTKELADEVFFYILNNVIVGYLTLQISINQVLIKLIGVDQLQRGKGIGKELLKKAVSIGLEYKCNTLEVATQYSNKPACLFYENFGFIPAKKENIFHFWL